MNQSKRNTDRTKKDKYSELEELFQYDIENKVWSRRQVKKAVMYGAGNIGRGFIGKTFSESGYKVCFIDVEQEIIQKINEDKSYPVRIIFNDDQREETVKHVRAVSGFDLDKVAEEIASADIMATAVGVNVLPRIVKTICSGLKKRFNRSGGPLNIIICENLIDADKYLRKLIENEMGTDYKEVLDKKLGLVEASIGRMVPVMTDKMREGNILRIWVEPYDKLPVDKDAFAGGIPDIKGLVPYSPFGYYIKRKLFIHNMGHALCAYLGWRKGYVYIYECVADESIRLIVRAAMEETAGALHREYAIALDELNLHIDDLITRLGNQALGDTVARVGRDPLRKLGHNDRLVGAALYCMAQNVEPQKNLCGIVAGLRYDNAEDESAVMMQSMIQDIGIDGFLQSHCGLEEGTALFEKIMDLYQPKRIQKEEASN